MLDLASWLSTQHFIVAMSVEEVDYRDGYGSTTDDDEGSQTKLPDHVIPQSITEAMSVEHMASFLRQNNIPDQYCKAFTQDVT